MHRSPLALAVLLTVATWAAPCLAAPSPTPAVSAKPKAHQQIPGLTNKVHIPTTMSSHVSSASCNRRTIGVNPPGNQLGPNGASASQTLVAVPIGSGSGNVASATRDHQISEVCAHQRQ